MSLSGIVFCGPLTWNSLPFLSTPSIRPVTWSIFTRSTWSVFTLSRNWE
jgi:hypothetical protein